MKSFPLPIKAVVIDLDGTLLDTAPDLAHAAEPHAGRSRPSRSVAGNDFQPRSAMACRAWSSACSPARWMPSRMRRCSNGPLRSYQKHYGAHVSLHSRPFPGVVEGLERFKAMGLHVACITNKAAAVHPSAAEGHRPVRLFRTDPVRRLPAEAEARPAAAAACLRSVQGVAPAELLLIGDSLNDIQAARAAGCRVLRALWL